MRGIIASDIDRTLTNKDHVIPDEVVRYLKKCYLEGFEIVFLTGRTFAFSSKALSKCDFPFHLGVQNGAEVLKMPEKQHRLQKFLSKEKVLEVCSLVEFTDRDFAIYSGMRSNDICYYNPKNFHGEGEKHIQDMIQLGKVKWQDVESFQGLDEDQFSLMRICGSLEEMKVLKEKVDVVEGINSVILSDVTREDQHIIMVSQKEVGKGQSLRSLKEHYDWTGITIGCGDDLNDVSLFEEVDISIGMKNGHPELLKNATILAEPSYDLGIIAALEKAKEMTK